MTGEGVEAAIVMLVIIFAVFHMVRKKSREGLEDIIRRNSEKESREMDDN
ncbi:hypothetical protein [Maridesulfovibrio sp.]|nr:hypothetical protein [Maridesulfovibrio sp.]